MIHTTYANKILSFITAKEKQINGTGVCYLGLSATEIGTDGKRTINASGSNFNEPDRNDYPSYERIQISVNSALEYTDKFGSIADGFVENKTEFTTRECLEEGGWPVFYHFGLFDAKTGGHLMMSDLLRDSDGTPDTETGLYPEKSLKVEKDKVAIFRAGALQLKLN